MNIQDYKNSNKYRIENTYVMYQKGTNSVNRWCNDGNVCFFGSKEDVWCGLNETDYPHMEAITAEELFSKDERLFVDYIKAIDEAIESGEIEL